MTNLIDVMRVWVSERGESGLLRPWLVFREGGMDSMKRSARIEVEDPEVMGQIILWEPGECEIDLGSTTDAERTLIASRQLAAPEELTRTLEEAMEFSDTVISKGA